MPAHGYTTTTPTMAATIAARAPFAPLTTTFTPDPPCATPALYGCTVVNGIGDERTIACAASHYTETRCSQSYSCYPDQGPSGYTHAYTYSPASICPVGFTTAGSRTARGTEPGGVACCPTGYSWASTYYGGHVDCDREPMTEGTLAAVLVETSTFWQTLCTAVPTTLTWAAQGPSATLAYLQYDSVVTAVGRISVNFNAQGVFLKDHTLTGSYTNLLSTTASRTSSTSSSTTTLNLNFITGGGGGGGSAPTTAQLETEFNIKVGVGVGVAGAGIILSTLIGCLVRRSRAKKRRLRQTEAAGGPGTGAATAPATSYNQSGPGLLPGLVGGKPELHASSAVVTGTTAREGQQLGESTAWYSEMDSSNTRPTPELDLHEAPRPYAAHSGNGTSGAAELGHNHHHQPSQTYQTQELGGNARSELHGDYHWYHPPGQLYPEETQQQQQQNQVQVDREMHLRQQLEAIRAQEQQITQELQGLGK